ncbi:hypothetical protein V493_06238 [Pseudogymnoascus sp. VKM F-4281 (FW-2241)]|nr:hypothetical protein V493_06238 [Pseudogymnoascus sp. VKM F-4281 (FW-2241)]
MAYNPYGQPPFGRPSNFGAFPGAAGGPPGMGPPPSMGGAPGMSAPGTAPPGMNQANTVQSGRPSGLPASFQGPTTMPNINFSAPVIRLGTGPAKPSTPVSGGPGGRDGRSESAGSGRPGLGADRGLDPQQQRQALRDSMMALAPPTKEEIVRTIFVAGITEGSGGNEGIERILNAAGRLRRWDRAIDSDGKECSFGFAQYEDAESLSTAVEVLKDIEVPLKKQTVESKAKKEDGDDKESEPAKKKLLVFVDDNSLNYLENWHSSRGDDPAAEQSRLDNARAALKSAVDYLFNPTTRTETSDSSGDVKMHDNEESAESVEVVNIPLAIDDELADIPAEMRETVAKEITAFRDRSNRRDIERLKREEEMEAAERARNGAASRPSRLASPGPAPSRLGGDANNIPLGPRDRSITNAPSGPKGANIPRDYQKGVSFVNGSGTNGAASGNVWINREDEDDSASDSELEQRRVSNRAAELEKQYLDQERRWLNRERSRTAAVEREKERDEGEDTKAAAAKEKMAQRLRDWNDDEQANKGTEEYYSDRSMWNRNRAAFRAREAAADAADRTEEGIESARERSEKEAARGMADNFLDRQAEELGAREPARAAQQPFKLSLGAAAQKAQKATTTRRTVAEVEGLLEDEEDATQTQRRQLIPIKYDALADRGAGLSDEEREQAVKDLAAEIPTDRQGLWDWTVQWEFMDESTIKEKLRPFVERKIVEYLGVQEQTIVEVVEEHVRRRGGAAELVEALEGALDEEAEVLVKKLWRMIIFFSESEKRGLSA